jgi:serine/threonine-protein kinase
MVVVGRKPLRRIASPSQQQRVTVSIDPPQPMADPRVGSSIGGYTIEGLLGVGGMGQVYEAKAPDGTRVALKLVKEDYAADDIFRRRFNREARIAQTVDHPHVVPVLDTGEHEGLPYMAQKFVEGGTLEQRLKRDGPLDVPTAVRICSEVADGLEALWAAGMVHRDVKPANILLDQQSQAYITDFGLAKDSQGSVLTIPGQALGSMDYMAPEQIRGEQVTAATDIYALGCVMFECMCGRPPFADRPGMRVLWAHLQDEPAEPCPDRTDVPQEFTRVLMLALRKDPSERPVSAGEYARTLANAAGGAASGTAG